MKTNLRRFRFNRGELSQQQLADRVMVSRQTIVSIEGGDCAFCEAGIIAGTET